LVDRKDVGYFDLTPDVKKRIREWPSAAADPPKILVEMIKCNQHQSTPCCCCCTVTLRLHVFDPMMKKKN
jgi:hypothetical protein